VRTGCLTRTANCAACDGLVPVYKTDFSFQSFVLSIQCSSWIWKISKWRSTPSMREDSGFALMFKNPSLFTYASRAPVHSLESESSVGGSMDVISFKTKAKPLHERVYKLPSSLYLLVFFTLTLISCRSKTLMPAFDGGFLEPSPFENHHDPLRCSWLDEIQKYTGELPDG
jgi:hypothetical protein